MVASRPRGEPTSAACRPSTRRRASSCDTGSNAVATARPTLRCGGSGSPGWRRTRERSATSSYGARRTHEDRGHALFEALRGPRSLLLPGPSKGRLTTLPGEAPGGGRRRRRCGGLLLLRPPLDHPPDQGGAEGGLGVEVEGSGAGRVDALWTPLLNLTRPSSA